MKNPDKLWYDLINRLAEQSKCSRRKVGCLIVYENRIIGQGYNGAPEGSDCKDCPRPKCRGIIEAPPGTDLDLALCAHAEANAIGYCARHGIATRDATLYVSTIPCMECAKLTVAAGIKEVVFDKEYGAMDNYTYLIFRNKGINIRKFNT